jgi:hypothetical protein
MMAVREEMTAPAASSAVTAATSGSGSTAATAAVCSCCCGGRLAAGVQGFDKESDIAVCRRPLPLLLGRR